MKAQSLLVELFVEELPPKSLKKLGEAFASVLFKEIKERDLACAESQMTAFASPRRLAVLITEIRRKAPDKEILQKLMSVSAALKDGVPTEALRKKLDKEGGRSHLADLWPNAKDGSDSLVVQGEGKSEALFLRGLANGSSLSVGLQSALEDTLPKLPILKVMTYQLQDGWTDVKFVRPAHSLVVLHGSEVIPIEVLGLEAGRVTHGHRFEAVVDPVRLESADTYATALETEGAVIANYETRSRTIIQQLRTAAAQLDCRLEVEPAGLIGKEANQVLLEDPLVQEVTALVERPNVLVCEFEKEFLQVPQECLILTMKANQKYFPLLDAHGKLTNKFLVVSNIRPADPSAVIGGNERVIRPRLADAKFFFDQDRRKTLVSHVDGLAKVVYHNDLGTQHDRVERVRAIAKMIGAQLGSDKLAAQADLAAMLAKADLLTDMVGEFPELQGTMGRYYALNDGLGHEIADAIEDHYKPRFAGDGLPRNQVGLIVALADKLETLVGMFAIGNLPTGDKDPFALRRHALGMIRMLMERDIPIGIDELFASAKAAFGGRTTKASPSPSGEEVTKAKGSGLGMATLTVTRLFDPGTESNFLTFIYDRLAGSLREQGYSAQEVDAVLALRPQRLGDVAKRLAAVRAFAALPEAPALAAANKRIGNILKKADRADAHVSQLLLREDAEKALYAMTQEIAPRARSQFESGDYTGSLQTLAALREPVDAFFDGVMVNAEEADLRLNRLGLLATLHQAMNRVADLSRLAT